MRFNPNKATDCLFLKGGIKTSILIGQIKASNWLLVSVLLPDFLFFFADRVLNIGQFSLPPPCIIMQAYIMQVWTACKLRLFNVP